MYENNLTKNYQNYLRQPPVHYMNNKMINNNPIYTSNIYDQNFYQQMMMAREEQLRKIRNVSELGLTKEQLTEYVICPIKEEKSNVSEIAKLLDEENIHFTQQFIEDNWWKTRTNAPYKNILKDQDWTKNFKNSDDLIVHKYTNFDKIGLMDEYDKLCKLLEKHNNELKSIFSVSKENEYKLKFDRVQKQNIV